MKFKILSVLFFICLISSCNSASQDDKTTSSNTTSSAKSIDRTVLPIQPPENEPITEMDARDVEIPEHFEVKAPEGAPNIVIVLIDDIGFGATSTFGGPISTPTFDRLANNGLRFNRFHTTALCSPTRASLLPENGDYQIIVAGTYYQLQRGDKYYNTFGKYRLNIGVNAPGVLSGNANATGDIVATQIGMIHKRVQEIIVEIDEEKNYIELPVNVIDPGHTLYVYVENISGDLIPTIKLRDYGNRLLAYDNLLDQDNTAALKYRFKDEGENLSLIIRGDPKSKEHTNGKLKVIVGINTPDVLTGKSAESGRTIIRESNDVEISLYVDQISDINQRNENFTVVAYLIMKWQDSSFAFNPDKCKCNEIDYTRQQFFEFIQENNLDWPKFIILNQQGRRFIQEDNFRIYPDGEVQYFERFTVTLQAPDFDFRKFPFDPQQFFVRIMSLNSVDFYKYFVSDELPSLGKHLGEEEWVVINHKSFVEDKILINKHSEYILEINTPVNICGI